MNSQTPRSRFDSVLRSNLRLGASRDARLAFWLLTALLCGFLAYVARVHEITHDVFHEMALFREALANRFPVEDVFAFTPTVSPAVHHEWGTGAILYLATVESGLGVLGLSLLRLLLIALIWLALYRVARMRGAHPYVFAAIAFATFPVFWVGFATVRAQLFTLVFLSAQMWMQELDTRGRRAWTIAWWFMLVAWLNIHAGFVLGIGMLGFHCLERVVWEWYRSGSPRQAFYRCWHLLLTVLAIPLALPINPYGWHYISYLAHALTMPRPLILEWQALWYTYAPIVTLTAFGLSLFLFAYCQRHCRLRWMRGAAFLSICAYETFSHIRHGSIYGLVWLAYVPAWVSRTPLGKTIVAGVTQQRTLVIRASQCVAFTSLLFASVNHFWLPSLPAVPQYSIACFPTSAVDYLKQNDFSGHLITPFNHGAYLSWTLFPRVRVSLDGRYEVAYQPQVMEDHHQLFDGGPEWAELLEKYPSDAVLVEQASGLRPMLDVFRYRANGQELPTKNAWRICYEDDAFIILAAAHCALPTVDRRGQPLIDGAWQAFSPEYSFRSRTQQLAKMSVK
jgi:hypothetical protein